jgi:hypothetical protein
MSDQQGVPVTREELLACVHELREGDLLVVRAARSDALYLHELEAFLQERLAPRGVEFMVLPAGTSVEVARKAEQKPDAQVTINVQPPKPEIRFVPVPLEPGHRI